MPLPHYTSQQARPLSRVLKAEAAERAFCREAVTILAGDGADRTLDIGAVLAKVLFADPVITPDGGNTGDGALGTLTLGDAAKVGDYVVTCIAAAADGGRFQVVDPDGNALGDALVGVAYTSGQINFTITDGAADWAVGDFVTVTIDEGSGKYVLVDFAATDGTQLADRINSQKVTAPDGVDAKTVALKWGCLVAEESLIWPAGATDNQKAAALSRLADRNILTGTEV